MRSHSLLIFNTIRTFRNKLHVKQDYLHSLQRRAHCALIVSGLHTLTGEQADITWPAFYFMLIVQITHKILFCGFEVHLSCNLILISVMFALYQARLLSPLLTLLYMNAVPILFGAGQVCPSVGSPRLQAWNVHTGTFITNVGPHDVGGKERNSVQTCHRNRLFQTTVTFS
jgi:hypothetical protein